jgi:hypothetical protein
VLQTSHYAEPLTLFHQASLGRVSKHRTREPVALPSLQATIPAYSKMPKAKKADKPETSAHPLQSTKSCSEACQLLLLQEHIHDISHAQQILDQTLSSLQQTELLAGSISDQDLRTLHTASLCLRSLRIRVEASANAIERKVIEQQLQLMDARVQPCTNMSGVSSSDPTLPGTLNK